MNSYFKQLNRILIPMTKCGKIELKSGTFEAVWNEAVKWSLAGMPKLVRGFHDSNNKRFSFLSPICPWTFSSLSANQPSNMTLNMCLNHFKAMSTQIICMATKIHCYKLWFRTWQQTSDWPPQVLGYLELERRLVIGLLGK